MMNNNGVYPNYIKRFFDIICSLLAIIFFSWLFLIVALLVRFKLGSPIIFTQPRPGKKGKDGREVIFNMYKFRTMTDECDEYGNLLPDEKRLTKFGKRLRATSMDELPEAFNILKGDMSVIGPRPQLVRDLVFMDERIRNRHLVKPGLSGLAQVNGRNSVSWEQKFEWDLVYVKDMSFFMDLKILFKTVGNVFIRGESSLELDVTDDYGDYLLKNNLVSKEKYDILQSEANDIILQHKKGVFNDN